MMPSLAWELLIDRADLEFAAVLPALLQNVGVAGICYHMQIGYDLKSKLPKQTLLKV